MIVTNLIISRQGIMQGTKSSALNASCGGHQSCFETLTLQRAELKRVTCILSESFCTRSSAVVVHGVISWSLCPPKVIQVPLTVK